MVRAPLMQRVSNHRANLFTSSFELAPSPPPQMVKFTIFRAGLVDLLVSRLGYFRAVRDRRPLTT
jgi:hypothetical protein